MIFLTSAYKICLKNIKIYLTRFPSSPQTEVREKHVILTKERKKENKYKKSLLKVDGCIIKIPPGIIKIFPLLTSFYNI